MENFFDLYNFTFQKINDIYQDDIPRKLRLFNIRFRLALDIEIKFKGDITLTKTKEVRDTYILIIKLLEIWNSYEAFIHYLNELNCYIIKNQAVYKKISKKILESANVLFWLKNATNQIKDECKENNNFKNDFSKYIERIKNDENLRDNLKVSCSNILNIFDKSEEISGQELIALIYAERNMYYHNGETAKMGMSYANRKKILTIYIETLKNYLLNLANWILEKEIDRNK